ncbi:MAG: TatD family hydrolase [Woeseiaceae bacterium]
MSNWFDIGANLADSSFHGDLIEVLLRARDNGVQQIVITGSSLESNQRACEIAASDPDLHFTAGIHPHHAASYTSSTHETLAEQMTRPGIVAAGECGLDYFRDIAPRADQAHAFKQQLELAATYELPIFLHQRDAHDDFVDILTPYLSKVPRAVAHCFTAGEKELRSYIEMGLYIGITGWICDERRGQHLLDIVRLIPDDKLMIETDAPYLLPRTLRPKPKTRRNEPAWLPEVAKTVATARGVSLDELANQTTRNAEVFFGLSVDR